MLLRRFPRESPLRKFLGRTCLVLAATFIGLLLGEVVIRVLDLAPAFTSVPFGEYVVSDDPELLWELRAGAEGVNTLGLRGPPLADPPARFRIALLGDSVAYGLGLGGEETIAVRLQTHLREAGFEVLDLAGPVRELLLSSEEPLSLPGDSIHPNALGADVVARAIAVGIVGGTGK